MMFTRSARDLVCGLLRTDESQRLGLLAGGVADIKAHAFYAPLDWQALQSMSLTPPFRPSEHEWGQATTSPADSKRAMAELAKLTTEDACLSAHQEEVFKGYG